METEGSCVPSVVGALLGADDSGNSSAWKSFLPIEISQHNVIDELDIQ